MRRQLKLAMFELKPRPCCDRRHQHLSEILACLEANWGGKTPGFDAKVIDL
jgi:hypothetical protein